MHPSRVSRLSALFGVEGIQIGTIVFMEQAGLLFFTSVINVVQRFAPLLTVGLVAYFLFELKRLYPAERLYALLMFAYLFLITATYWLMKPIKKALFVEYYKTAGWEMGGIHLNAARAELIAKELNFLLAILAAWGFAKLARWFKREKLAFSLISFFGVGFLLFTSLVQNAGALTRWAFYCYGDFFITLMIAGFFAFLNDSGDTPMVSRVYGVIGLGGILGGFFGSTVLAIHVKDLGPSQAAWIAIGALGLMVPLAFLAGKRITPIPLPPVQTPPFEREGILRFILRSPYLLGMAAMVGLYEMISTLMDYQFTSTVLHFVPGDQMGGHFANVYFFTNMVAVCIQLFLTRRILMRVGVIPALFLLPLVNLIGEVGFVLLPGLLLGSLLNTFDNALAYSLNPLAKEALYVPMEREAKYRGKGFIDVFVLRGGKALSVIVALFVTMFFSEFEKIQWLSFVVLGLLILWLLVIFFIRPRYAQLCAGAQALSSEDVLIKPSCL